MQDGVSRRPTYHNFLNILYPNREINSCLRLSGKLHPLNVQSPMLVTLEGMTMVEREPQSLNAKPPMLVTLEGMTILDRERQLENALSPMLVTLEGMTISDRESQP